LEFLRHVPAYLKKTLLAIVFIGLSAGAVTYITVRTSRTEIDPVVADVKESHTCPYCGYRFTLSISEAVNMRRSRGDIVCPKCGRSGALKDDALASTDLVRDTSAVDKSDEDGDADSSQPRQKKKSVPTATISRDPAP
jgi:transcription elongation factor Elf1